MSENFLKITYHSGAAKKMNAYMKMPSPTFAVLCKEIELCLFEEHKHPRSELRKYWIDCDHDEIEVVNQNDYEIFMARKSQHLQVSPKDTAASATKPNEDDPAAFTIHDNVECDGCLVAPIVGFRYKCIQCPNFDLCQRCEAQHKHADHMMVRMPNDHCPSVIEAYVSGRHGSGRRGHHKRSSKVYCPVFATAAGAGAATATAAAASSAEAGAGGAQPEAKEQHGHGGRHGHKHHRRQMRQGLFTHLYDMMQDLAEGGASAAPGQEEAAAAGASSSGNAAGGDTAAAGADDAAGGSAQAAADAANKKAQEAAEAAKIAANKAAEFAHQAAHKVASEFAHQAAHKVASEFAHQAAQKAASGFVPMYFENAFAFPGMQKQENKNTAATPPPTPDSSVPNSNPTAAPNTAEPEMKKSKQTNTNNATPTAATSTTPNLGSPTLENLAQFVDPQYMKAGIQILNNFSEMFAKMLDPLDGGEAATSFASAAGSSNGNFTPRKQSTCSSTSTSNLSTSSSKQTQVESQTQETAKQADEPKQSATPPQQEASLIDLTPVVVAAAASASTADDATREQHRRSQSEDSDWQLVDKQTTNGDSFADISTSTSSVSIISESNGVPTSNGNINFAQLSKDLQAHVEEELKREQESQTAQQPPQQQNIATATAAAVAASTETDAIPAATAAAQTTPTLAAAASAPTPAPVLEQRAVPVFHADERINNSVIAMMAMGFSNEGAWLTQLLESVNGNIPEALDVMSVAQRNNQ